MANKLKYLVFIIVGLGVFHGARRLYSSHMLFAESLHGDQGSASPGGHHWQAPAQPTQSLVDELVLERKTRKHLETELQELHAELSKMKDELNHLTEHFSQQQAITQREHRTQVKKLEAQVREFQTSERVMELEHCRADEEDLKKKNDALRKVKVSTDLEASTKTCSALVSQMRSQLQDKILLLMGANLVSHMTAYCAGAKVPSLTNLTEFQRPQCPAFTDSTSVRATLLEQKLEDVMEMRRSLDDTQQEYMLRTLLSAKQGLFNVSSAPWMQDDVTIQPLVEDINVMFESDLDVSAHQLYVDSLRTAAPMLMKDLAPLVFIDRRARSRMFQRTPETEAAFKHVYEGVEPELEDVALLEEMQAAAAAQAA
eukprot:CAMPEP_0118944780 /NCGR_PEP_ID=MMETSP1169-20130426/40987_1 /TAXON_ID=36882 /ORGANISM="Pyramimonas obovata, Strain CCMP722" /LENGTH=369 /DNA_ID=CAMNT_0006890341 /DNA_START=320 /DNA_END=1425 /DNA_ORIENTATION=+